mmetsp:Transcript_22694/g.73459  ORF Transcript_22694/g.73459 Transcript_22694/m.73459 type:complete len:215 (-) Transcript_22694:1002-1646(-)
MRSSLTDSAGSRWLSDCHLHLDFAVRLVSHQLQIGECTVLEASHRVGDLELREEERLAGELLAQRLDVVVIDVRVPDDVHKVAALEAGHVRQQAGEQRVRGDVERHAEAQVSRALVHLAGELPVGHVELGKHVAGRQRHFGNVGRVPGGEDDPPVVRLLLDRLDDLSDLVHPLPGIVGVHILVLCAKVPPLPTVDGPEVALLPVGQPDRVEVVA